MDAKLLRYSRVLACADHATTPVERVQDIIDLAGTLVPKYIKPMIEAREAVKRSYRRRIDF